MPRSLRRQRGFIIDPFRFVVSGPTDPFWGSVAALYHLDADGANSKSSSTPDLTLFAAASITAGALVWGAGGLELTGAVNSWAQHTGGLPHASINFGTGDFVVEFWFRSNASQTANLIDLRPSTASAWTPTIYITTAGDIRYFANGIDRIDSANSIVSTATEYYAAAARVSGTTRLYFGTIGGGTASDVGSFADANTYVDAVVNVGAAPNGSGRFNGDIDELRITVGNGRGYSGATIPIPTAAFPNS